MSDPAINIKELTEIMDDDRELIHDCFSDFIDQWPQIYDEIKQAALAQNAQILDNSAHKLKGILKYLAAQAASDAAYTLEFAGKKSNLKNLQNKVKNLKKECLKVEEYINNFEF